MNAALAAAATMVAVAFCLSTLDRWLRRRRPHEAAWTISLAIFAAGAAVLWWAETRGWSLASFRLFFLAGAVLNVPWLALGTVYLLAGRRAGDRTRAWLLFLSGVAVGIVLFAPTEAAVAGTEMPTGKDVFGVAPRVLGNVLIAVGTLVLSASGTLAGRLGKDEAFAVTLLLGICVLFAGFLVASAPPARRAALHAVATPATRASASR